MLSVLGINCYPQNNKSRFRILLASLLVKPITMSVIQPWIDKNKNSQFNSIREVMDSLLNSGFQTYDLNDLKNKIEITFLCDSSSGYNYIDFDDFDERKTQIIVNDIKAKNISSKEYFETIYKNDVRTELDEIKSIFNEFTELVYPIKTYFEGTPYHNHCNVNRNVFMEKHMDKFIFFSDDDDFNSPLTQKIKHVESYIDNYNKNVVPLIQKLIHTTEVDWLKLKMKLYYVINSLCQIKDMLDVKTLTRLKELILTFAKYDLCKLYSLRNNRIAVIYHFGTTMITPYTLNHYTTSGEVFNEDVYFEDAHGVCLFGYKSEFPDYIYIDFEDKNKKLNYTKESQNNLLETYFNGLFSSKH